MGTNPNWGSHFSRMATARLLTLRATFEHGGNLRTVRSKLNKFEHVWGCPCMVESPGGRGEIPVWWLTIGIMGSGHMGKNPPLLCGQTE